MSKTNIEWTNDSWNPVVGCTKVSPGCRECYAEKMAVRLRAMALSDLEAGRNPGRKRAYIDAVDDRGRWTGKLVPVPEALATPLTWRKPRRVFVNSMSDLFHEDVPDAFIAAVFGVMAACPQNTFQVLTKRPDRMLAWFKWFAELRDDTLDEDGDPQAWPSQAQLACRFLRSAGVDAKSAGLSWPLPNVWLGVSVEDQQRADERIWRLLDTPAVVRFLSCEPLLEAVDLRYLQPDDPPTEINALAGTHGVLRPHSGTCVKVDWVIVGGESGANARPCNVEWVRSIIEQCRDAGVACFVKQIGSQPRPSHLASDVAVRFSKDRKGSDPAEWPEDLRVQEFPA